MLTTSSHSSRASAPVRSGTLAFSSIVATIAFVSYARTLLPGVDLGDTGGFQAAVLWPEISARQAYPLYYALASPFVGLVAPSNPARGLNLFSALCAALAVGLLTGLTAHVSRSVVGGIVAGLLLAFSYTFWTQAVIAEVYALHLALVGVCLVALAAYGRRRNLARLLVFFGVYALSFGNHLSMILLLVPFATFLLMTAERPSALLQPKVIALALLIAALGALQYLPNLMAVWTSLDAPERWTERLGAFWFDVTKSDWRETMVLGITGSEVRDRLSLFAFDAHQQFGTAGLVFAAAGAIALWRANRPWAVLVLVAYTVNTLFAFTYNVGDPHVFFLPGHFFVAMAAGCFISSVARGTRFALITGTAVALALVAWRGYDTWPAVDRHADRRAEQVVGRLTLGIGERDSLLVTSLNWQVENALLYEARYGHARDVVWTRLPDVFLHFPLLVQNNHASGRDVVLTSSAATQVRAAFGPLFPLVPDAVPPVPTLQSVVARIPRGAPYVLTLLTPPRGEVLDDEMLNDVLGTLTGGARPGRVAAPYELIVGRAGEYPIHYRSAAAPFRVSLPLPEGRLDVRMDGWVPLETFRRGGFGHVMLDREPLLTVERGLSLMWLGTRGAESFYAAGLYAPQPRFRIARSAVPRLALLH
jgi:hypothetical protein